MTISISCNDITTDQKANLNDDFGVHGEDVEGTSLDKSRDEGPAIFKIEARLEDLGKCIDALQSKIKFSPRKTGVGMQPALSEFHINYVEARVNMDKLKTEGVYDPHKLKLSLIKDLEELERIYMRIYRQFYEH
ncbi:MAG TPA: hypothetical protein VF268_14825 [Gammaproteobacteria bacterium]